MVQNDVACVVTGATARYSITLLMGDTGLLTLPCRRGKHSLALYIGDVPPDIVGYRTRYPLRRPIGLIMPMYRT